MREEPIGKIGRFFYQYKKLSYKKREIIIRADDIPSGIYYLRKGYVRVYALSETGQELSLIIFTPGNLFPMFWAINDSPNIQYYEAITNAEVIRAPREDFQKFIKQNADVVHAILSRILIRQEGLLERMGYMVFGNAYQRVASILIICSERFGVKRGKDIFIRVPLTHRDIANLIGLTRETTSIELKKLEKAGVVYKKGGHFRVRDLAKLKTEAQWERFV